MHGHGDLLAARNHQHLLTDNDAGQRLTDVLDQFPTVETVRDNRSALLLVVDELTPTPIAAHGSQVRVL